MKRAEQPEQNITGFLGVGLDNSDGHTRITRGKNFSLLGGSADTHAIMQETAVKINETIDGRGKRLEEVSREEFREIVLDVTDRIGRQGD